MGLPSVLSFLIFDQMETFLSRDAVQKYFESLDQEQLLKKQENYISGVGFTMV